MHALFRSGPRYLALLVLALAVASVASHRLLGGSYAGVSEDAVRPLIEASAPYLRTVMSALGRLLLVEAVLLFALTVGVLALRRAPADEPAWGPGSLFALAGLVVVLFVGFEAHAHPGLFLPVLSSSRAAAFVMRVGRWGFPLVVALSALGWGRAITGEAPERRRWVLAFVAVGPFAVGLGLVRRHASPFRGYRSEPDAPTTAAALGPAPGRGKRPNVLLLAVDSLRPDKIDPSHTPALASLVARSIYFPNALVTLPRTGPSWTAMLTSLPPLENGIETMFPARRRGDLSKIAMPAHLASLGYATYVSSEYAGEFFDRVDVGFAKTSVPRVELREILGQALLSRHPAAVALAGALYTADPSTRGLLPGPLADLLRGSETFSDPRVLTRDLDAAVSAAQAGELAGRPFFATLFFSQPHFPYTSSYPYYEQYAAAGASPALAFGKDPTHGAVVTDADRAQIDGLYRGALAETDAEIGRLLASLAASAVQDDTIVILTADHGEALYECGECVGHGDNLRGMTALRVPLAFLLPKGRFPDARPTVVDAYVSQLDLYPTVLSLLDVARPAIQQGTPLVDPRGAALAPPERTFFVETGEWLWPTPAVPADRVDYPPITTLASIEEDRIVIDERYLPVVRAAKHRAAIRPPYKLVYAPGARTARWSLFDVVRDPAEARDLKDVEPRVFDELREALRRSVLRYPQMLAAGDYFLTRPAPPPEEYY